jgi:hypothetical protein
LVFSFCQLTIDYNLNKNPIRRIQMKKISAFVLASSLVLASTAAFAGGANDVAPEPMPAPPVVVDGGSSSALPIWAILGGVLVIGSVLTASN